MFGIVANIVVGLMRSLFGLVPGGPSGGAGNTVVGTLVVRQSGGVAGTDEIQISHDGTDAHFLNPGGTASTTAFNFGSATSQAYTKVFGQITTTLGITHASNVATTAFGAWYGHSSANLTIQNGFMTTTGWLQSTAGRSRVAGDITNVTIAPAVITGLSATLLAGRKYSFEIVLFCSEATAADGLRLDYDGGTATMTSFLAQGFLSDDNGFQAIARTTALATDTTNTTITGSTVVVIKGTMVVNAAGTFIPRFAKEADAAGAALTVTAGSYMLIEDIP